MPNIHISQNMMYVTLNVGLRLLLYLEQPNIYTNFIKLVPCNYVYCVSPTLPHYTNRASTWVGRTNIVRPPWKYIPCDHSCCVFYIRTCCVPHKVSMSITYFFSSRHPFPATNIKHNPIIKVKILFVVRWSYKFLNHADYWAWND
jgi:hypothetical protein